MHARGPRRHVAAMAPGFLGTPQPPPRASASPSSRSEPSMSDIDGNAERSTWRLKRQGSTSRPPERPFPPAFSSACQRRLCLPRGCRCCAPPGIAREIAGGSVQPWASLSCSRVGFVAHRRQRRSEHAPSRSGEPAARPARSGLRRTEGRSIPSRHGRPCAHASRRGALQGPKSFRVVFTPEVEEQAIDRRP